MIITNDAILKKLANYSNKNTKLAREVRDGKILFATDTGRLFIDNKNNRVEITDFVKGLKYSEIINLKSPLQKIYLSSDSHQLLLYDFKEEKWLCFSGGIVPEVAIIDIYFKDDGKLYLKYGDGKEKECGSQNILLDKSIAKI